MALLTFLVEDNPTIRDNLIPTLADLADAPVVGVAETETQAAAWLRDHADVWHLAVIDLFLREGSGLGVLSACTPRRPHQRVVVLTNYATPDIRARCLALGADAVFDKSNELDDFFDYCSQDRPSQMAPLA
jgi:DNA-binding NarL/FixJ family response regulator